jgi:hypothetical protein
MAETLGNLLQEAIDHCEVKTGTELRWLHGFPRAVDRVEKRLLSLEAILENIADNTNDRMARQVARAALKSDSTEKSPDAK